MKSIDIANIPTEHLQFGRKLIEQFLQIPYIKNNTLITREANHALSRLNDKSFKIAVVGEFSSGKSTFLNAIIGKDYLAHGVQETTATVTMLVNTNPENSDFGKVVFSDGTVKALDNYSQLKEMTTTQSSIYKVSHQINSVELFISFMDTEFPIVLVDTPGLNGVAAMHRERTIDIIKGVHACIYMLQSRGISKTDEKTLQWISQYQSELIIVQNFIDDISKSEGDTLDEILDVQRRILLENVFPEQDQINYTVCGISAMKALVAKDETIKRLYSTDSIDLTSVDRIRLYQESNFEQAMDSVNQFMQYAFQRSHLSALHSVFNLLERTKNILSNQYEVINAIWGKSGDAQIVLRTRQLIDNWETRQAENAIKLDNFIVSKMNEYRQLAISELRRLIEESQSKISHIFSNVTDPEEWDGFIKEKIMENEIANITMCIKRSLEILLAKSAENIHNLAILRIQEYSGLTDSFSEQRVPTFQAEINGHDINRFTQDENDIKREEEELQRLQSQNHATEYQREYLIKEEGRLEAILSQERQRQSRIDSDYERQKRVLGQTPGSTVYYETVTERKKRGGVFGSIGDFFDGGKKITRQETQYDYTAQRQWEENERQLKNEYNRKKTELASQLRFLEHEISSIGEQIASLSKITQSDMVRIDRKKDIIFEKIEALKEKRLLAAKEYVQRQKDKLRLNVCDYLNTTLQLALSEIINNEVVQIIDHLRPEIQQLYTDVSRNQKENLQHVLNKNRSDDSIQHENLKCDMEDVFALKNKLEEYLCKQ